MPVSATVAASAAPGELERIVHGTAVYAERTAFRKPLGSFTLFKPKLRPVRQAISGLTWAFTGSAGWVF